MTLVTKSEILELVRAGKIAIDLDREHPPDLDAEHRMNHLLGTRQSKVPLSVGSEYYLFSKGHFLPAEEAQICQPNGSIVLGPGDTAIIKTRERLSLPSDVGGTISSKLDLAVIGLSNISTSLDPGFQGYLAITVTNLGGYEVTLPFGTPIAYANLMWTRKPVEPFKRIQTGSLRSIVAEGLLKGAAFQFRRPSSPKDSKGELQSYATWKGRPYDIMALRITELESRIDTVEKLDRRSDGFNRLVSVGSLVALLFAAVAVVIALLK